jgi:hypothetical protein
LLDKNQIDTNYKIWQGGLRDESILGENGLPDIEKVKLPALKGGASRKGKFLFQIASLKEKAGLAGKRTGQTIYL